MWALQEQQEQAAEAGLDIAEALINNTGEPRACRLGQGGWLGTHTSLAWPTLFGNAPQQPRATHCELAITQPAMSQPCRVCGVQGCMAPPPPKP